MRSGIGVRARLRLRIFLIISNTSNPPPTAAHYDLWFGWGGGTRSEQREPVFIAHVWENKSHYRIFEGLRGTKVVAIIKIGAIKCDRHVGNHHIAAGSSHLLAILRRLLIKLRTTCLSNGEPFDCYYDASCWLWGWRSHRPWAIIRMQHDSLIPAVPYDFALTHHWTGCARLTSQSRI